MNKGTLLVPVYTGDFRELYVQNAPAMHTWIVLSLGDNQVVKQVYALSVQISAGIGRTSW